jgi:hypothetical protein
MINWKKDSIYCLTDKKSGAHTQVLLAMQANDIWFATFTSFQKWTYPHSYFITHKGIVAMPRRCKSRLQPLPEKWRHVSVSLIRSPSTSVPTLV